MDKLTRNSTTEYGVVDKITNIIDLLHSKNQEDRNSAALAIGSFLLSIAHDEEKCSFIANAIQSSLGPNSSIQDSEQIKQNYESFFDSIDEFLFVLDGDGSVIYANKTVFDRLGFAKDDLYGQSVLKVHPPERRNEAERIVGEMLSGQADFCPVPLEDVHQQQIPVETRVKMGSWNGQPAIFGVTTDMTRLKFSEEKFSKLFEINPSACGLSDYNEHTYVEVNPAFYQLLGYDKQEVIGRSATELGILSPEMVAEVMSHADESGNVKDVDATLIAKNGDKKYVQLSSDTLYVGERKYRFTAVKDLTDIKKAQKKLRKLAIYDKLTGLRSRNYLMDQYESLHNESSYPLSIIYADVDGLKSINDTKGHAEGDSLLRSVGQVLKQVFDKTTCAARSGGDEFTILLPNTTEEDAKKLIEKIHEQVSWHNTHNTHLPTISISIGSATARDYENLLSAAKIADERMYESKRKKCL